MENILNPLYPSIYKDSTNQEIQAIIYIQNYIVDWIQREIETKLQLWTITEGVSDIYLKKLSQYINWPYVDTSILKMMQQKKIINRSKISRLILSTFPIGSYTWSLWESGKSLIFRIHCNQDETTYQNAFKYRPLIQKILEDHSLANMKIVVNIRYHYTLKDYQIAISPEETKTLTIQNVKDLGLKTVGEVIKYTGDIHIITE